MAFTSHRFIVYLRALSEKVNTAPGHDLGVVNTRRKSEYLCEEGTHGKLDFRILNVLEYNVL